MVDAEEVHWFSRQGHEHGAKSSYDVLDGVVRRQAAVGNLVLDGELIVWRPNE
jgi:ATP-dependent DNA ligase